MHWEVGWERSEEGLIDQVRYNGIISAWRWTIIQINITSNIFKHITIRYLEETLKSVAIFAVSVLAVFIFMTCSQDCNVLWLQSNQVSL